VVELSEAEILLQSGAEVVDLNRTKGEDDPVDPDSHTVVVTA